MKAAVIYWSGTGNTEQMAQAIADAAGAELFAVSDSAAALRIMTASHSAVLQLGDEVLEEDEFEPFFASIVGRPVRKDHRTVWLLWLGRRRMDGVTGKSVPRTTVQHWLAAKV